MIKLIHLWNGCENILFCNIAIVHHWSVTLAKENLQVGPDWEIISNKLIQEKDVRFAEMNFTTCITSENIKHLFMAFYLPNHINAIFVQNFLCKNICCKNIWRRNTASVLFMAFYLHTKSHNLPFLSRIFHAGTYDAKTLGEKTQLVYFSWHFGHQITQILQLCNNLGCQIFLTSIVLEVWSFTNYKFPNG